MKPRVVRRECGSAGIRPTAATVVQADGPARSSVLRGRALRRSTDDINQGTFWMAMENYSAHQQKIIKNYYHNRENIAVQRVQELITELYLATGKKREKVWDQLAGHLEKLGTPPDRISHLRAQDKPELVATLIQGKL
jgi:hypothetical protein